MSTKTGIELTDVRWNSIRCRIPFSGDAMPESKVPIRTQRQPGHCWQENELYDVFWPIVGPQAGNLFCCMTRLAYGAEVEAPLRELAQMSGYSKDTVRRSVLVMEAVGMVRRKSAGKYELVDLKLLIHDLGGIFLRHKVLWDLPVSVRDRLRAEVKRVLAESQKKSVSVRDTVLTTKTLHFVSAPDSGRDKVVSTQRSIRDKIVSSDVDFVSSQGQPYIQEQDLQEPRLQVQPPTPFTKGEALEQTESILDSDPQEVEDAVQAVMDSCRFTEVRPGSRLRLLIAAAMRSYLAKDARRGGAADVASLMVSNWKAYLDEGPNLRYTWSPRKFFEEGHWINWKGWPIDQKRAEHQRNGRVGCG